MTCQTGKVNSKIFNTYGEYTIIVDCVDLVTAQKIVRLLRAAGIQTKEHGVNY